MAIFGRLAARQRLRRATEESFTVPTFSAPLDCTPWVIGGLWPAELSTTNSETDSLAKYLKVDLERIADSANDELRAIGQAGIAYPVRRAAEARVIDEARALALRRIESTMRQIRQITHPARPPGPRAVPGLPAAGAGSETMPVTAQVLPAVRELPPPADMDKTQVLPRITDSPPPRIEPTPARDDPAAEPPAPAEPVEQIPPPEDDEHRLQRLLAFAARQESGLCWAVGDQADGTTLLVTDLAHGWIPPGVRLPEGVRLLAPARRTGRAAEWLDTATRAATYIPGGSSTWSTDFGDTKTSAQPLELPAVEDLGWELGVATHWRDGLPRMVNVLAKAAADGAHIAEQEIDLLRVHLDTTRYLVLAQYPEVDPAALLNCMLLAATEASTTGDSVSANYHFAWFRELTA